MLEQRAESALERFEKATALPMLLLSLLMIPMAVIPLIWDLPRQADVTLNDVFWVIWALFAIEYATRLSLANDKVSFLRHHVVDLVVVLLPFFRSTTTSRGSNTNAWLPGSRVVQAHCLAQPHRWSVIYCRNDRRGLRRPRISCRA